MASHLNFFFVLSLLFVSSLFILNTVSGEDILTGKASLLTGAWKPISNPNDPIVVDNGKFAISQHNKVAGTNLEFVTVVKGDTKVVAGIDYRLIISAKDGSASGNYQAIVWDKPAPQLTKTLISFVKI